MPSKIDITAIMAAYLSPLPCVLPLFPLRLAFSQSHSLSSPLLPLSELRSLLTFFAVWHIFEHVLFVPLAPILKLYHVWNIFFPIALYSRPRCGLCCIILECRVNKSCTRLNCHTQKKVKFRY